MRKKISVVAAIITSPDNHILLSKRKNTSTYAGMWEFPGGKIEDGETPIVALQREIYEELDIKLTNIEDLSVYLHSEHSINSHTIIDLMFYICRSYQGTIVGKEGQEVKWIPITEIVDITMPPADIAVVRKLAFDFQIN